MSYLERRNSFNMPTLNRLRCLALGITQRSYGSQFLRCPKREV